jgi:DNA-binding transcriptional MerR regulator
MEKILPPIPAKRYFTIGEVSELCGVKPYVLRYWEQEFTQLKPVKRRGNRRYYQHHEVLLIRRIRDLLYEQGFTISGARNRLGDMVAPEHADGGDDLDAPMLRAGSLAPSTAQPAAAMALANRAHAVAALATELPDVLDVGNEHLRNELLKVRDLLTV